MIIQPAKRVRGPLRMPGDKSISHRAAIIAAVADGTSRITNFSTSADCAATLSCLQELGVPVEHDGDGVLIHGIGIDGLHAPRGPLDCGNSGTTMRLLAGILAGQNFASTLIGDKSLRLRPMQRIIEPLQLMGARVSSHDGRAPLAIEGQPLRAIRYESLIASAQVKSCILFAGLNGTGRTEVIENIPTRDHTERMLSWFGAPVNVRAGPRNGQRIAAVDGPARFNSRDLSIPGDLSSAAFFVAAASLLPGSSIEIQNVGLNPTRALFLKQLRSFGFDVAVGEEREECNEPIATVRARGVKRPKSQGSFAVRTLHHLMIPQLIDELPLLAVLGTQLDGGLEIRDAAELRVKESDRISTTVQNLRAMGADVTEFSDGLRVAGPTRLRGAPIDSHGDHRIAMAFAIAALLAEGETEIKNEECVAVSCPEFFRLLDSVREN